MRHQRHQRHPHLRLVSSSALPVLEQGFGDTKPAAFALLEKTKLVAIRKPIPCAPVPHGRPAQAATDLPNVVNAVERFNQIGYRRNHGPKPIPNRLEPSSVISLGETRRARFGKMRRMSMKKAVRDLESLADRIAALRVAQNWEQTQAAKACGLNLTTWNNYEEGVSRPTIDNAAAICEVFGVTLDFLYTGDTTRLAPEILRALYGKQA